MFTLSRTTTNIMFYIFYFTLYSKLNSDPETVVLYK